MKTIWKFKLDPGGEVEMPLGAVEVRPRHGDRGGPGRLADEGEEGMSFLAGLLLGAILGFVAGFVLVAVAMRRSCRNSCRHPEESYDPETGNCGHCGKRIVV